MSSVLRSWELGIVVLRLLLLDIGLRVRILIVEICLILRETGGRIILKFVGEGLGLV
jgi:hypothetical protein